jgi:hypothetical protein
MTTEELAAPGLPSEPVAQDPENAQPPEEEGSPAASESRSYEDGEVKTDDEDVRDVDADVRDLVRTRPAGPLTPSLVFGESKVTTNMITEYEAAGFFPSGIGRAPLDEQTPTPIPKTEKLLYFATSSLVALGSLAIQFSPRSWMFFR